MIMDTQLFAEIGKRVIDILSATIILKLFNIIVKNITNHDNKLKVLK